jgi:PAS domain S-box-containing protein
VATSAFDGSFDSERFKEIADAAPVGLWRINSSFEQDWVNRYWLEFTGGRLEDEVGFAWIEKVHPDDRERVLEECDRAFDAREATAVEFRLLGKDGQYRWFHDSAVPFYRGGEFSGFVGSCFDITERKQAEAQLKIVQAGLIERSAAEAATILGSDFGHAASQPLLAIESCAHELERLIGSRDDLPPEIGEAAASIRRATDHARDVVAKCRDGFASGAAHRNSEDLAALIRSTEPLFRMLSASAGVALTWELAEDLSVRVNATQIRQVVLNLVANGLRAMDGMAAPEIVISAARWGDWAVVSVADGGHGIAEGMRERVFEPTVGGNPNGMGLGLYLCRAIIAAHGGRIWVEERPGGGSIFRFTVPLGA